MLLDAFRWCLHSDVFFVIFIALSIAAGRVMRQAAR
jgi:hypothetical protein